jgi:hypothetical protein
VLLSLVRGVISAAVNIYYIPAVIDSAVVSAATISLELQRHAVISVGSQALEIRRLIDGNAPAPFNVALAINI